jgi:hypothetical protein
MPKIMQKYVVFVEREVPDDEWIGFMDPPGLIETIILKKDQGGCTGTVEWVVVSEFLPSDGETMEEIAEDEST